MAKKPSHQNRIEMLQGTLDLLVLQTLRWGPQHGYGIARMIQANSQQALKVETGSLYPALHRLERKKFIAADWETSDKNQRVRVYRLTPAGKKQLAAEQSWFEKFSNAIASMAKPPVGESES
jgi:PadR family transcriptional regulator PadR